MVANRPDMPTQGSAWLCSRILVAARVAERSLPDNASKQTCAGRYGINSFTPADRSRKLQGVKSFSTVLFFAATLTGICVSGAEKSAAVRDFAWIEQRVRELQPAPKEKRFDEIGWAKDIRTAKRLAKENNRPVFLFTHDGRMNIGRC